jgi:hypothetical protein
MLSGNQSLGKLDGVGVKVVDGEEGDATAMKMKEMAPSTTFMPLRFIVTQHYTQ